MKTAILILALVVAVAVADFAACSNSDCETNCIVDNTPADRCKNTGSTSAMYSCVDGQVSLYKYNVTGCEGTAHLINASLGGEGSCFNATTATADVYYTATCGAQAAQAAVVVVAAVVAALLF